jgi:hypothetical protein
MTGTHFGWRLSQTQGHSAAGRIMSVKKFRSNRDLLVCSAFPQPTATPRALLEAMA